MVDKKYLNGKVDPVREGRIIDITRDEIPKLREEPQAPNNPNAHPPAPKDPRDEDKTPIKTDDKDEKPDHVDDKRKSKNDDDKTDDGLIGDRIDNGGTRGFSLPNTATTIYTTLLIGGILVLIGAAIFIYRKYRLKNQ